MGTMRNAYKIVVGKPEENSWKRVYSGFLWLRKGTSGGLL
jgi:hypothetical protein